MSKCKQSETLNPKLLPILHHQCMTVLMVMAPDEQVAPCEIVTVSECVCEWVNTKPVVKSFLSGTQ